MLIRTSVQTETSEGADPSSPACDGLSLYLHDIGAIALLTQAEERNLVERMRAGDARAKARMIEANVRLVVFVAKRYSPYVTGALDLDDLIQAGSLGLMQAVERYEPERGSFSTHAVWWIRQAISRTLAEQGRTIRLPVYIRTQLARMARLSLRLFEEHGKEPTEAELAEAMGLPVEQVRWLIQVDALPVSLDQPTSSHDERTTLAESLADPACLSPEAVALEQVQCDERRQHLTAALSELTAREQMAVRLRFGLDGGGGSTLRQVGERMGISRERARQLIASALAKFRHSVHVAAVGQALSTDEPGKAGRQ